MNTLILARGGSKGIPKKNIKILNNKPLIGHVIDAAKRSQLISHTYVSTDCDEIADVAYKYGADIIERPDELASDTSLDIDAFIHALQFMPECEEIIHLRATTPIIDAAVLDQGIRFYLDNKQDCTSMRSGHEMTESAYKFYTMRSGKFFTRLDNTISESTPRQLCIKTFKPNGYIDIVKTKVFKHHASFYGHSILAFLTDETVDIDSEEDFAYLEFLCRDTND